MVGPSTVQAWLTMPKPLAAAVRITCSPKLNVVAATGAIVRLSADAVIVNVPPPAQASALAAVETFRATGRIDATRKKRDALMSFPLTLQTRPASKSVRASASGH